MREDQRKQLDELWEKHMKAMKLFIQTGESVALDEAERIAEQMKQIRESAEQ